MCTVNYRKITKNKNPTKPRKEAEPKNKPIIENEIMKT